MILEQIAEVPLPAHDKPGGFDHAAVHGPRGQLYVAHTANNAVDVIDCSTHAYLGSISGLEGVAGALVCEDQDLVFTSNRGEDSVGIFPAGQPEALVKVKVGRRRLFCACDGKALVVLDSRSGAELAQAELGGVPDVIFFNRKRRHLYVASGDPGLIEVFETDQMRRLETVRTEAGAHTLGFDASRNIVYAFLPNTHRALVFADRG